jgi:hypothetical protein
VKMSCPVNLGTWETTDFADPLPSRARPPFRFHQIRQNIVDLREMSLALTAQPLRIWFEMIFSLIAAAPDAP